MEFNRFGKGLNIVLRKFNFILSPLKSFTQERGRPRTSLERLSEQDESEKRNQKEIGQEAIEEVY